MKKIIILIILIYTTLYSDSIIIDENTKNLHILQKSFLFIDKDSKNSISSILQKRKDFTPIHKDFINYGYIFKDTIWIKFTLHNNSNKHILKYLVLNSPNIDIINLYFYKNDKEHLLQDGIFTRKSFQSELGFKLPLALEKDETITYYLEVKALTHSIHFAVLVNDLKTFKTHELHHQLILTIFFAILFVIVITNIVIFIHSKNSIYIYYSFFIFSIYIHHLSLRGMIGYFVPANQDIIILQAYMPVYYLTMVLLAIFLFVKEFLNLSKYKKLYTVFKFLIFIILSVAILHSRDNYMLNYMTPLALTFALYVEFIGLYIFVKTDEKNAKYFFLIWSISLAGMVGTMLYYVGILSHAIPYLFEVTVTIEVLLFSIVLSSQIKTLQEEKIKKDKIILEQSKLSSMGEMLQNIAHQWRQPLSEINAVTMKIDADFYKDRLNASSLEKDIQRIENITFHMSNTIESFSSYFKHDKQLEITTFEYVINKTLNIMDNSLKDVTVIQINDSTLDIDVNISELIQVILVILNNAVDAFRSNKIQNKILHIRFSTLNNRPLLEITDNAGGIPQEYLTKVFEPYFSTKFKANGIGIGLYMAKILIEENLQGTLEVSNIKNGAKFTIKL